MERETVERSCGNVFADLGLEDPEELLLQAELALAIRRTIRSRKRSRASAAKAMGIAPGELSGILDHPFDTSTGRLLGMLNQLGQNVELVVTPKTADQDRAKVRVRGGREQAAAE